MKINKRLFLFCFVIMNICTYEVIFSSPLIYENYKAAPLLLLIIAILTILFVLIYPNKYHSMYQAIFENIIVRIILFIYLFFFISYSFGMISFIFHEWFYDKTPFLLIILFLIIPLLIVSKNHKFIFFNSFILGLFLIFFNILPVFNSIPRNISFLKEFEIILKPNNFFFFFIGLDSLLLLILSNNVKEKIQKKNIILSLIIIFIYSFFLLLENYFFLVPDVFIQTTHPSFLKYQIYFINYLIDNIDIVLIINILFFCFSKLALYINLFFKFLNRFKTKSLNILFYILIYLSSILFYLLIFDNKLLLNEMSLYLLILLVIFFLIQIPFLKEKNDVKQIQ